MIGPFCLFEEVDDKGIEGFYLSFLYDFFDYLDPIGDDFVDDGEQSFVLGFVDGIVAEGGSKVGLHGIVENLADIKDVEDEVIAEGMVDVDGDQTEFLFAFEVFVLFVVQGHDVEELKFEHFVVGTAIILKPEFVCHFGDKAHDEMVDLHDFIVGVLLVLFPFSVHVVDGKEQQFRLFFLLQGFAGLHDDFGQVVFELLIVVLSDESVNDDRQLLNEFDLQVPLPTEGEQQHVQFHQL